MSNKRRADRAELEESSSSSSSTAAAAATGSGVQRQRSAATTSATHVPTVLGESSWQLNSTVLRARAMSCPPDDAPLESDADDSAAPAASAADSPLLLPCCFSCTAIIALGALPQVTSFGACPWCWRYYLCRACMVAQRRVSWMRTLDRIAYYRRVEDARYPGIGEHTEAFCFSEECLDDPTSSKFNDMRMQYITHDVLAEVLRLPVDARGRRDIERSPAWTTRFEMLQKQQSIDSRQTVPLAKGKDGGKIAHPNDTVVVDGEWQRSIAGAAGQPKPPSKKRPRTPIETGQRRHTDARIAGS
jgi:hypothetical protein